jgi:ABC-type Zn2+ transport system substrate-binding protein/surface adhesin
MCCLLWFLVAFVSVSIRQHSKRRCARFHLLQNETTTRKREGVEKDDDDDNDDDDDDDDEEEEDDDDDDGDNDDDNDDEGERSISWEAMRIGSCLNKMFHDEMLEELAIE